MTEQPIEPVTEQEFLGNGRRPAEAYLHDGHRLPRSPLSAIARLDIEEARAEAAFDSAAAIGLMRARLNAQTLLTIAEKESTRAEEALKLALEVEDTARGEVLKASGAIDEFARKTAGA